MGHLWGTFGALMGRLWGTYGALMGHVVGSLMGQALFLTIWGVPAPNNLRGPRPQLDAIRRPHVPTSSHTRSEHIINKFPTSFHTNSKNTINMSPPPSYTIPQHRVIRFTSEINEGQPESCKRHIKTIQKKR